MAEEENIQHSLGGYKTVELGAVFFTIGLTFAIYSSKYILPEYLEPLRDQSKIKLPALIFLFSLTLTRFITCIYLYSKPFKRLQWFIFIACGCLFFAWHTYVVFPMISPPDPTDFIKLEKSRLNLHITNQGNAMIERDQYFIPLQELSEIPETDIYSSVELTKNNFSVKIEPVDTPLVPIPSVIEKTTVPGRFVNKLLEGYRLMKGKRYQRMMILEVAGAFTDTVSDQFIVIVSYVTDYLELEITFEAPCRVDSKTLRYMQIKQRGNLLVPPKSVTWCSGTNEHIFCFISKPEKGDEYSISWYYLVPPKPPK